MDTQRVYAARCGAKKNLGQFRDNTQGLAHKAFASNTSILTQCARCRYSWFRGKDGKSGSQLGIGVPFAVVLSFFLAATVAIQRLLRVSRVYDRC